MSVEKLLADVVVSLETHTVALKENTAAVKAAGGAKAVTTAGTASAAPKKPAEPKIGFDEVKVAAEKVMTRSGKPFAKKLISDVGGAKELASVKPEKYGALLKAFETALADAESEGDGAEADEDEL